MRSMVDGLVPAIVFVGVAIWFGRAWLAEGLPGGDFGGNVAYQWHLKKSLAETGRPPAWSQYWFCGQPLTVVQPGPWFLPFMTVLDPIQSIKVGCLVYFGLSGWLMYLLVLYLTGSRSAAYLGGLFYSVHPIHVSVTAWTGHPNFGPFYLWPPLLFLALVGLARRITYVRTLLLALVVAAMAVSDVERMVTVLLPAIVGALIYVRLAPGPDREERAKRFWRYTGTLAGGCALAVVLSMWFIGPVVAESPYMTLFSPEVREESVHYFSLQNPVHLIDRAGGMVERWSSYVPGEFTYNKGFLYLSLTIVGLAIAAWLSSRSGEQRRLLWAGLAISATAVWLAGGMYSVYNRLAALATSLYRSPEYLEQRSLEIPILAGTLATCGLLLIAWHWLKARRNPDVSAMAPRSLALIVLVAAGIFISPAVLFRYVPFLNHMRSPSWFMSFAPTLGLCLMAAALPAVLRRRGWGRFAVGAVTLAAAAVYGWDVLPYRKAFAAVEPVGVSRDLKQVAAFLAERARSEGRFRVMSRETYNPRVETQVIWSEVPAAWSWLNWASPKAVGQLFLEDIYPKLHRPETISEAVHLAGVAGVKYLIYDLTEGPRAPPNDVLEPALETEHFVVYRNKAFRPFVQFLPGEVPESAAVWPNDGELEADTWSLQRPTDSEIRLEVNVPSDGTLMLAEAWYPGWAVERDGSGRRIERVQHAFQGVRIGQGLHELRFSYARPRYFATSAAVSVIGLFLGLLLAPRRIRLLVVECVGEALLSVVRLTGNLRSALAAKPRRVEVGAFVLLLAGAGTVRLYNLANNPLWYPDEAAHVMMAESILEGSPQDQGLRLSWLDPYHPYPPGLDLAIAALIQVVGKHVLAARLVTAILTTLTVAAVFLVARWLSSPLAGWVAGVAIGFHPLTVLFHRWGFAAAASGAGVALTVLLAVRFRNAPSRRRFFAALAAASGAAAFSYWSFPIVLFVLYVAATSGRETARQCLKPIAAAVAGIVVTLAVAGWLGPLVGRIGSLAAQVGSAHEGQMSDLGGTIKTVLGAGKDWLGVDWLLAIGTVGLVLAPRGWPRRDLLAAFFFVATAPILLRAELMANFFYNALIFAPIVFVGLGCFVAKAADAVARLARAAPHFDGLVLHVVARGGAAAVCVWMIASTCWADQRGWKSSIDVYCVADPGGARAVARWIDQRVDGNDFVIGSTPVGWLLHCRLVPVHHVVARTGLPTTWMVRPPTPDRFAFDCSLEKAKFLWIDNHFRAWSVWQQNADRILHRAEQEGWPLVHQQGQQRVYANPRFWSGPTLVGRPLLIAQPEVYRSLADRFMREERYEDALGAYQRLMQIVPGDASAANNAGVAAARLEHWSQARELWMRALELDPELLAAREGLQAIHGRRESQTPS